MPANHARVSKTMSDADVAVVETALRTWNAGDRDGFLALFHPGKRPIGWVFRLDGGLIREVRAYPTREKALEAAGLEE